GSGEPYQTSQINGSDISVFDHKYLRSCIGSAPSSHTSTAGVAQRLRLTSAIFQFRVSNPAVCPSNISARRWKTKMLVVHRVARRVSPMIPAYQSGAGKRL